IGTTRAEVRSLGSQKGAIERSIHGSKLQAAQDALVMCQASCADSDGAAGSARASDGNRRWPRIAGSDYRHDSFLQHHIRIDIEKFTTWEERRATQAHIDYLGVAATGLRRVKLLAQLDRAFHRCQNARGRCSTRGSEHA